MKRRLGYYAHHHGAGHLLRAAQVASRCATPVTILSSSVRPTAASSAAARWTRPAAAGDAQDHAPGYVELVRDDDGPALAPWPRPDLLHYAPIGHAGLRRRMAQLAGWFAEADPAALVVDVSVEVTLLARVTGIAPVVVRQFGRCTDPAHRAAYDSVVEVVAFWPSWAEDPDVPQELRDRTRYVGGTSRFAGRSLDRDDACRSVGLDPRHRYVVVLRGSGGDTFSADQIRDAAKATRDRRWLVLGQPPPDAQSGDTAEVKYLGQLNDPLPVLRCAEVVVTHGGQNAVMDAAAADVPLVVLPQPRPFAEQERFAAVLDAEGCAVVRWSWPAPAAWPSVLEAAVDLDRGRARELVGDGASTAAMLLDDLVTRLIGGGAADADGAGDGRGAVGIDGEAGAARAARPAGLAGR